MAYSTTNPPALITQRVGATGGAVWYYTSTDNLATVNTDGYITNAADLGMAVGDIVWIFETDTGALSVTPVVAVNANGSADLGDGTVLSSTDTD